MNREGNDHATERQAQEGNDNGYDSRYILDGSDITITDGSRRDEGPVKALGARPSLFPSHCVPEQSDRYA